MNTAENIEEVEISKAISTELAEIPQPKLLEIFTAKNGLDPFLEKISEEVKGFVPDVSTARGRKEIASIAYKVTRSRTALDNAGKDLVAKLKELPKAIDAERKRCRDYLDKLQADIRQPLTDWEKAEESRVNKITGIINEIKRLGTVCDTTENISEASADIRDLFSQSTFDEFLEVATNAKNDADSALERAYATASEREAQAAELERLRQEKIERDKKEREERIAREAVEAERKAAEARRNAEREAEIRKETAEKIEAQRKIDAAKAAEDEARRAMEASKAAELAAHERALKAENDAKLAIEKAAREAEAKAAAERKVEIDRKARIDADKEYRKSVEDVIVDAITATVPDISESAARDLIRMINAFAIPGVSINY